MTNQSRRTVLKGMGYGIAALASAGATSTVMACTGKKATAAKTAMINESLQFVLADQDITIYLLQPVGEERVSLVNLDDKPVRLDKTNPVSLKHVNGSLVLTLNHSPNGEVTVLPKDRLMFEVKAGHNGVRVNSNQANTLARYVTLRSEHLAFNGTIPALAA